jgi:flagellar P-ring protein precursor FlgI
MMIRFSKHALITVFVVMLAAVSAYPEVTVKIRDLAYIDGFRENQVLGYGLVVGLQGTGDTKSVLTDSSLRNMLKNLGLNSDDPFVSKNTAAVVVTAKLPPYARIGDRVDVMISSIGNAKSIDGGVLVQSPLKGADDKIYVVAQGPLSMSKSSKGEKGVRTVARIVNGVIVERAVEPDFITDNKIALVLNEWDFNVATQMIKSIGELYSASNPAMEKGGKIRLSIPKDAPVTEFISKIEELEITPIQTARIVISERDGTIVTGGEVKISEVMVSREGLTVQISAAKGGQKDASSARKGSVMHMKDMGTVKDLVDALNFAGASTRDTIAIFKALKDSGALHAELIVK